MRLSRRPLRIGSAVPDKTQRPLRAVFPVDGPLTPRPLRAPLCRSPSLFPRRRRRRRRLLFRRAVPVSSASWVSRTDASLRLLRRHPPERPPRLPVLLVLLPRPPGTGPRRRPRPPLRRLLPHHRVFTVAVAKIGPGLLPPQPARHGAGAAVVAVRVSRRLRRSPTSASSLSAWIRLLFGVAAGVGYGLSVQISAIAPFGEGLQHPDCVASSRQLARSFTPSADDCRHRRSRPRDVDRGRASLRLFRASVGDAEPWGSGRALAGGRRDASQALTPSERNRQLLTRAHHRVTTLCLGVQASLWWCHTPPRCARTAPPTISTAESSKTFWI